MIIHRIVKEQLHNYAMVQSSQVLFCFENRVVTFKTVTLWKPAQNTFQTNITE
jgi:hypothetical protein